MGGDLRAGSGLASPVFDQYKLLPELLVTQYRLIQPLRLLVQHIA